MVVILGDIRKMRKITESAHDTHGFGNRHSVENSDKFASRRLIFIPMKADRCLSDAFDQIEDGRAFLIPDCIAENSSQQPNIAAQLSVVFGAGGHLIW